MLPAKSLSEMTDDEIMTEIRSLRTKRVAAKERTNNRKQGDRKTQSDNLRSIFDTLMDGDDE